MEVGSKEGLEPCSYSALVLDLSRYVLKGFEYGEALVDPGGSLAKLEDEWAPSFLSLSAGFELRGDFVSNLGEQGVKV